MNSSRSSKADWSRRKTSSRRPAGVQRRRPRRPSTSSSTAARSVPEHPADHRRALEGGADPAAEVVEARLQHPGERGRHPARSRARSTSIVQRAVGSPGTDHAVVDEHLDELLDEERVAVGAVDDEVDELVRHRRRVLQDLARRGRRWPRPGAVRHRSARTRMHARATPGADRPGRAGRARRRAAGRRGRRATSSPTQRQRLARRPSGGPRAASPPAGRRPASPSQRTRWARAAVGELRPPRRALRTAPPRSKPSHRPTRSASSAPRGPGEARLELRRDARRGSRCRAPRTARPARPASGRGPHPGGCGSARPLRSHTGSGRSSIQLSSSYSNRDLPTPASPTTGTTAAAPLVSAASNSAGAAPARRRARSCASRRPRRRESGSGTPAASPAARRRPAPAPTCRARPGRASGSTSNTPRTWRYVSWETSTDPTRRGVLESAGDVDRVAHGRELRRRARRRPAAPGPVLIPTRIARSWPDSRPEAGDRLLQQPGRPAPPARRSSSWAASAPHTPMTASPMCLSIRPPRPVITASSRPTGRS